MLSSLIVLLALAADPEVARIQDHLAGAELQVRAADVTRLSAAQRARRAAVVDELARYRARGRFPRNLDFDVRTPYFIDDRGVRCAMAHLIEVFGGGVLVARVAATANNAYVADLAADPELLAWLDQHGLTVAEAARIQPSYQREVGFWCDVDDSCISGRCQPAPDFPEESYCTIACDPETPDPCPIGDHDTALTCQAIGDEHLCLYVQTPTTPGWPCDLANAPGGCYGLCIADEVSGDGVCVEVCSTSASCNDGLECRSPDPTTTPTVCLEPLDDSGCSAGGGGASLALVLLFAVGLVRRRR